MNSLAVTYNENGRPVRYADHSGKTKKFERDAFGRVVKELLPDDSEVAYTYNKLGQLHTVLDQNKHKITFDWNKFGLDARTTPAGQLTDYVHDKYGLVAKIDSKWHGQTDRSIKYEYDPFDRIAKIDYGGGNIETRQYDSWGKVIALNKNGRKSTFSYDYLGRLVKKTDGSVETRYLYNRYGQRTGRQLKNDTLTLTEFKQYDKFGRLTEIRSGEKIVKYLYNARNQLASQIVDNVPIEFTYTKYGQLETKTLGGKASPVSTLKYIYSSDGMIVGRVVDGKYQMYSYDRRGQLLRVADMQGNVAESYVYDPAGNILSKTIDGKTTTYTYDKANQLVSSECGGKVTKYQYDAAGRLIQEGDKSYAYGWLDKVLSVSENGQQIASFNYHNDGQIAQAIRNGKSEDFLWDGLALIHRGETSFVNEPYVTGGNPILSSKDGVMFNDMLGSTLNIGGKPVSMTAFGESADNDAMYTGKPYIGELGYAFLFRNYRADQGKWQTQDPFGYPDGWNNLAYVNNCVIVDVDFMGCSTLTASSSAYISIKLSDGTVYENYISTEQDLNNLLANSTESNKITEFKYTGHGSTDLAMLLINSDASYGLSPNDFANISQKFADNVNITLNACGQGKFLDKYLDKITVPATIEGFTGLLTPIGPLSWETVMRHPTEWFTGGKWVKKIKE